MAEIAGLDVTVIDPRTAFATEDRFPGGALKAEWPEDVLKEAPLDPFTAVAAVTHDPKIDDYPLMQALQVRLFLRRRARQPENPWQAAGTVYRCRPIDPDPVTSRIDAPIGLDIGAASPEEIAVAVLSSDHQGPAQTPGRPAHEVRSLCRLRKRCRLHSCAQDKSPRTRPEEGACPDRRGRLPRPFEPSGMERRWWSRRDLKLDDVEEDEAAETPWTCRPRARSGRARTRPLPAG